MKRHLWTIAAVLLGTSLILAGCKGKEGPAGAPGTSYTPPAALCTNPTQQGVLSTALVVAKTAGRLGASRVNIATATTAISLSMYIPSGPVTGQIRLGLYSDTGGTYPGTLIAEADPFFPALNTWNTVNIDDVYLVAGNYWIVELYSSPNAGDAGTYVNGGLWTYSLSYGWSMLPQTFPAGGPAAFAASSSVCMNTCP